MSWRRILLLSMALVVALGGATWGFLQHSDAATRIVRRELQALFRTPTDVRTTAIDLGLGRLSAHDLRIGDPDRPDRALLRVDRVDVDVALADGASLVGLHGVHVEGFLLEVGPGLPDLDRLLAPAAGPEAAAPVRLPPIELLGGRVLATIRADVAPLELRDVTLRVVPRDDAPRLSLTGSATLAELRVPIELAGDVDPDSGAATVTATLRGVALDEATIARAAALLGTPPPAIAGGATVRSLRVTATFPAHAAAGTRPRLDVAAELADVHVRGGGLPDLVTAATVALQADDAAGGTATLRLSQTTANGTLEVQARGTGLLAEPEIDVRVHGTDIAIDAEVLRALRLFDTGRDIVDALCPTTGRADLELFLRNPQRRGGLAELDLSLRDVAMSFRGFGEGENRAGFPLPMERTRGRVRLRDDVVLLEDVHASIAERAGGGVVRLQGRIDSNQLAGEDASLDIHAESVAFSPDLRAALTTLLDDEGALYDKFAPVGRTAVDVLIRPRSELPGGWSVEVRPEASSMQWAGFPYRLERLGGSVLARADGVTFDLRGNHGTGSLAMRGFIPLGTTLEAPGFVANVELAGITLDDDLRSAVAVLAPDLDAPWRSSEPTGRFDGKVKVWRPQPGDPLFHDARLELSDVNLRLPAAPWRAVGLQGPMLVQGLGTSTRVDFDALRGQLEHGSGSPARLAMLGNVVVGEGPGEDLAFVVRDLELDAQLGSTLEALDALGPGTWASLQPSGKVDLVCRHRRSGDRTEPLHVVVQLLDVRSEAPILLRPAEHMTGELQIAGGELRFDDVRAVLGGAQVTATAGTVRTRPAPDLRTEIAFTVEARGVPIDDGVANLFSGPLHTAVLQRQLLGRADVDSLRLEFAIPTAASTAPFETTLAGQLRLYDLDMTLGQGLDGILVHGISGVVTLADSRVSDAGGQLRGALRGVSLQAFGQPIESIDASFVADAEHIAVDALSARCHGGVLRSARPEVSGIHYLLPGAAAPEGRLRADLTFENVDVYTFLDHGGWTNPPYSGAASGSLALERLDGSNVLDAVGQGTIKVERADLGVVPLFTAIYAQLPAADRPRFDRLDVTWKVADRGAEFERFDVRSNILAARGKGRLGFDGYLDVEMTLDNLLGTSADPFVMPLISYLAQNIVSFHLHGYLRDLHAEKRWVMESAPARRAVAPMPPATPRPTAPDF